MSDPDRLCGLPRTSTLIMLASSIYYCRVIIENRNGPLWETLDPTIKHTYVAAAEAAIRSVQHEDDLFMYAVGVSREEAAKILTNTNRAPWGQDDSQGRD